MNVEAILKRLQGTRRNGGGWQGRCPAHADRSPSLSIREGNDGRVLLHCFAGCSIEGVCNALKINVSDLFSGPGTVHPKPSGVREAEKATAAFRSCLTPRERVLAITVVYCDPESLDAGLSRALALTVEGELLQAVLADPQ